MAKIDLNAMLKDTKDLEFFIQQKRKELQEKKTLIATEYTQNLTEPEKQSEIAKLKKSIDDLQGKRNSAINEFKNKMRDIKGDAKVLKERLDLLNYIGRKSLPKKKWDYNTDNLPMFVLSGESIKDITVDTNKANWKVTLKEALKLQGINGEDRVADNVVYKAGITVDAKKALNATSADDSKKFLLHTKA